MNPERKVSEKAFEVHGYSDEFLSSQKKFSDICDDFLNFIRDKKLIIHNAKFDISHLNNELSLVGKEKTILIEKNIEGFSFGKTQEYAPVKINKILEKRKLFNLAIKSENKKFLFA